MYIKTFGRSTVSLNRCTSNFKHPADNFKMKFHLAILAYATVLIRVPPLALATDTSKGAIFSEIRSLAQGLADDPYRSSSPEYKAFKKSRAKRLSRRGDNSTSNEHVYDPDHFALLDWERNSKLISLLATAEQSNMISATEESHHENEKSSKLEKRGREKGPGTYPKWMSDGYISPFKLPKHNGIVPPQTDVLRDHVYPLHPCIVYCLWSDADQRVLRPDANYASMISYCSSHTSLPLAADGTFASCAHSHYCGVDIKERTERQNWWRQWLLWKCWVVKGSHDAFWTRIDIAKWKPWRMANNNTCDYKFGPEKLQSCFGPATGPS